MAGAVIPVEASAPSPLAIGLDEHQTYLYELRRDASIALYRIGDGQLDRTLPLPEIAGAALTSGSRSMDDLIAAGTADGRVALAALSFTPSWEDGERGGLGVELAPATVVTIDAKQRPIRLLSARRGGSGRVVAAVADNELLVWTEGQDAITTLWAPADERITSIALGGTGALVAGTDRGRVHHWELGEEPRLTDVSSVSSQAITAVGWVLGDGTFVAGTEGGDLSAWFRTRPDDDSDLVMARAHEFPAQSAAISGIAISGRDRSFVSSGADGSAVLRFTTSERTLIEIPGGGAPAAAVLSPKGDALFVARGGKATRYDLDNPHPEITGRALFGKTWYEGYPAPAHVWQSTGGTNDFEEKFSLVPLIFGTMKGTLYAMLFAVPFAILAALYTSQFAHPKVKNRVKPIVEIMAALPSVVIGFIAGLWLAAVVAKAVVAVFLMAVLLPLFGTAGVVLWAALPRALARRLRPGTEILLIVPLLLVAAWLSLELGPAIERAWFGGDFKLWLATYAGLTYDQRNCLVVGLAMGFAVIPIIFTISEDAFSNVPSNLTAASLALGASRWQTAIRVVLPTASPGVFSAIMVGFGRAVGETMIVLMATGNTPVLDWSIFNGMRTLAANIAVEIPEAPHGGTLYRVLFLSAAMLFAMTFVVNTVAEVIRQRLRMRYRAL
jgi:phosphate transport system permease protein